MASGAVHFLFDATARLVALDESDGLLNFRSAFRPFEPQPEVKNAPIILTLVVCARILQVLVRHVIVRILGTSLTIACADSTKSTTTDEVNGASTNLVELLRRLSFRRSKILRSLACAVAYSILSSFGISLASNISSSHIWLTCAEIITSLLLEGLHLRWTQAISSKANSTKGPFAYPWRRLLLPTLAYAVAQKATAELPSLFSPGSSGSVDAPSDGIAVRSMAGLILAFALRFFMLYPAWASLICFETSFMKRSTQDTEVRTVKQHLCRYRDTARMCYQRVLLRLAGLHLQAAGILISIEAVLYVVFSTLST